MIEIMTELIYVTSNYMPRLYKERIIKTIRARGLIKRKLKDDPVIGLQRWSRLLCL
jgi:hypothetical protein